MAPKLSQSAEIALVQLAEADGPMPTTKSERYGYLSGAVAAGLERKGLARYVFPDGPRGQACVELTIRGSDLVVGRWRIEKFIRSARRGSNPQHDGWMVTDSVGQDSRWYARKRDAELAIERRQIQESRLDALLPFAVGYSTSMVGPFLVLMTFHFDPIRAGGRSAMEHGLVGGEAIPSILSHLGVPELPRVDGRLETA